MCKKNEKGEYGTKWQCTGESGQKREGNAKQEIAYNKSYKIMSAKRCQQDVNYMSRAFVRTGIWLVYKRM